MNKYEKFINQSILWLEKYLKKNNINDIVIGVSGGIDSAVTLSILKKIKKINIHAYFIDIYSSESSLFDATTICNKNKIKLNIIDLSSIYDLFIEKLHTSSLVQKGNIKARIRSIFLYDKAYENKAIVVGNSNYDELFLGYFTKYGDNAVDIMLLNNLLKKDIYELAAYLKIPKSILTKKPSADLYPNQYDESEIGITYESIDNFLLGKKIPTKEKQKIINLNKANIHKCNVIKNPHSLSIIKK